MIRVTVVIDAPDHAPTGFDETGPMTVEGWLAVWLERVRAVVWQDLSGYVHSSTVEHVP